MSEPHSAPDPSRSSAGGSGNGGVPHFRRPAPLLFEPSEAAADDEHFFGLESLADPRELLDRSTELALAFRAAADRAMEYQAVAAAQLADPKRFDKLADATIADRASWTEEYARKMIEFGEDLMKDRVPDDQPPAKP
ncbi:hypothetical protein OIE63_25430 [Streptomyces sp. NBC_01795]|uniref:hypothetical protein n=1 Tax=unclassified Streptomyces TaxID=2593676 RepID=UPI002DDA799C|nr:MULTISPECIES: hypothetical protein [unclassified Streptomyces]WSA94537.1 hypothetical protein OIE63_25430 [Streptomyces sp. NBC_01795]WSB78957.1 hypothetical protein OHB04_26550 [Streptomyces sp. NBC_01775]WSS12841.1 hypothetical protein OG533_13680 [Streptomyces sp. NBC_01186]